MPITSQERAILAACETEADLSVSEIARRAGTSDSVTRRALQKLEHSGVVNRRAYMNSFLLGTPPYLISLALTPEGLQRRKELNEFLLRHSQVGFVASLGGHYHLLCEVRASTVFQLQGFLDQLSFQLGPIFSGKEVLTLTSMDDFPVTATQEERQKSRFFSTSLASERVAYDELDTRILRLLGRQWEDSIVAIGRKLGQSATTLDYRLKRLRSSGILLGSRYFVNLFRLGHQFMYHLVSVNGFHPALRTEMLNFARSQACCNTFRTFIGVWDFIFECHYQEPQESLEFIDRLLERYRSVISRVESVTVLAHEKASDCTV